MKNYGGKRSVMGCGVAVSVLENHRLVRTYSLPYRFDLARHSPAGFEWGFGGSGPAQLALALLCDCLDDPQRALRLYQAFKTSTVANLPRDAWELSEGDIRRAVFRIEAFRIEDRNERNSE